MSKKEERYRYVGASICSECLAFHYRDSMHPARPCPECGGKVLDGFTTKEFESGWLFKRKRISPLWMRWYSAVSETVDRQVLERFREKYGTAR